MGSSPDFSSYMFESQLFQIYQLKEMTLSAEFFLSCSILQLTFYAVGTAYQRRYGFVILSQQVYSIGILIIVFVLILLLNENLFPLMILGSNQLIVNDFLSFSAKLTVCSISVFFLFIIKLTYKDELIYNNFEYLVLIMVSVLGLMLLCSSNDLITAYLSIELHSIAFYLMSAFKKDSSYSIESGLKYFITGALSSTFFLFGSAILYWCFGSLRFDDFQTFMSILDILFLVKDSTDLTVLDSFLIALSSNNDLLYLPVPEISTRYTNLDNLSVNIIHSKSLMNEYIFCIDNKLEAFNFANYHARGLEMLNQCILVDILDLLNISDPLLLNDFSSLKIVYLGLLFIFISVFIKLALAPFHFWSLDVYEGSPNSTTIFFAVIPKIALFVLLIRLYYFSFYSSSILEYQTFFIFIALLSIFIGSIGGLEQRKVKTLFAYSSVSHTGYLFLAFCFNTPESFQLMMYYLVIFMISGLCFWCAYLFIKQKKSDYLNKHSKELSDFVLLSKSNPMVAVILSLTLFSIAGIPPLIGFIAKVGIFLTAIQSSAYLIAVISILFSITSTFYYIRIVKILYFENILVGRLYHPIATTKAVLLTVLALSLIVLSLNPGLFYLTFYKVTLLASY